MHALLSSETTAAASASALFGGNGLLLFLQALFAIRFVLLRFLLLLPGEPDPNQNHIIHSILHINLHEVSNSPCKYYIPSSGLNVIPLVGATSVQVQGLQGWGCFR